MVKVDASSTKVALPGEPSAPTSRAGGVIDVQIGARVRERRIKLGMSQQQLAEQVGITYQQAHKYERGLNRISAGRLYDMARALGVPVSWFFEDLVPNESTDAAERLGDRLSLELARCFARIKGEAHRTALVKLARVLAEGDADQEKPTPEAE